MFCNELLFLIHIYCINHFRLVCVQIQNHQTFALPLETTAHHRKSPEKLSLASEPESAAIHCLNKAKVAGKGPQDVVSAKKYLVVDIGQLLISQDRVQC